MHSISLQNILSSLVDSLSAVSMALAPNPSVAIEFSTNYFNPMHSAFREEWENRSPSPSRLCSICSAPSNGYHFNAASCSACAAFFRRTVTLSRDFVCSQQGNCRVNYAMRVICRRCRYEKCIESGMERSAVQPRRDCNVGRRKISYARPSHPPPPGLPTNLNMHLQAETQSSEQHYAASYSSSISGDAPSPHIWSPPIQSPDSLLAELIKEERLMNERRRLLYCSHCSVSNLMTASSNTDIVGESSLQLRPIQPFDAKDLKELTFGEIQKHIRPQILVLYEWMRSWPYFPQLEPRERKALLRRCILYQCILDPSYLTMRLGLPDKFVMFNGLCVGISEDSDFGWKDEEGIIKAKMKKDLYRPLLERVLREIVLPMKEIGLSFQEYLILKSLISFKSASVADVSPATREIMLAYVDNLFRALHYHYLSQGASSDYIAQRTGNIVLLISSVFALGMECIETHQKIQFFDLWQLDELLAKLICSSSTSI